MRGKSKIFAILMVSVIVLLSFAGCNNKSEKQSQDELKTDDTNTTLIGNNKKAKSIILTTTTSTQDSGLLDYILPKFTEETGIDVKTIAVGTGKAIQMGVDGEADVLLVHAKASEEEFVDAGHGTARYDVMYNDFILLGPKDDPAGIEEKAKGDLTKALIMLYEGEYTFVSRGDDSGTDKKEKSLWKEASLEPKGEWYLSTGKGMGDVIQMANETLGYTLSDRATFLAMKDKVDLKIVVESDTLLINQYGVIPVNPNKNIQINGEGAMAFVNWILSEDTQMLIGEYGVEEYGQALFIPNAQQ